MVTETESQYLRVVVERVLNAETNDVRFEIFCNSLVSHLEGGAVIVGTSASWDLGRDGVGLGRAQGLYLCTSLRDDVDDKALSDIERITSTTSGIKRLYFCSSQPLSEHARSKLEEQLADETDYKFPITCMGSGYLSQLACNQPELVERHYGAEKADVLRVMLADPTESTEVRGLRLALISAATEDSASIRHEVYNTSLLDVLADGRPRTIAVLSKDLSEALKLHRNIAAGVIEPHVTSLAAKGFAKFDGAAYMITPSGKVEIQRLTGEGAGRLLALRNAVRAALEKGIGQPVVDDEFHRIWAVFEERVAHYFLSRGEAIVSEVAALLDEAPAMATQSSALSFLEELANAVGATSSHAVRQAELAQAVKDIFSDRNGPAAEWLVRISANFITACALGLEHSSSVALQKLLSRTRLVLDTDVVLSLLGEGEPEHQGVYELVTRWRRMGGKALVAEPVLEEVARHAWIAPADFHQVAHLLPGTAEDRLHLVGNAFVRSFAELVALGKGKLHHWKGYISQFVGTGQYDWQSIFSVLSAEYNIEKLPRRSLNSAELEHKVQEFLTHHALQQAQAARTPDPNAADKARRDSILYVAIVDHLAKLREQDPGSSCVLVSSGKRLLAAEAEFRGSGEPQLVVSIGAMVYVLSLLPDVHLGMTAMKAFLFDERRNQFSSEMERTVLRMIRGSDEMSIALAKRGVLMRSVRQKILKEATERGEKGSEAAIIGRYQRDALKPANEERTLKMLSEALDEVGVDRRLQRENAELKRKVEELERKFEKERQKKR